MLGIFHDGDGTQKDKKNQNVWGIHCDDVEVLIDDTRVYTNIVRMGM